MFLQFGDPVACGGKNDKEIEEILDTEQKLALTQVQLLLKSQPGAYDEIKSQVKETSRE